MEFREFVSAVENLLGAKCVQENALNFDISNDRLSVGINKLFLGGADVFLCYPGAGVIQPTGENLVDSFRRVQQAHERVNADWPIYQEQADKALKEFEERTKFKMNFVPQARDQKPGYVGYAPGIDIELVYITTEECGDPIINNRTKRLWYLNNTKVEPGIHPVECREVDNKWKIHWGRGNRNALADILRHEIAGVSVRKFTILPEVMYHDDPTGSGMPDNEVYDRLTQRQEYTFIEFEVV